MKSKPTRSQLGKRSRRKGKDFQKEVCKLIAQHLGVPEEEVYSCVGGKTEADVKLSERVRKALPFHLECKNYAKWGAAQMRDWIKQAQQECGQNDWAVVFKQHRGDTSPKVVLDLKTFLSWVV